MESVDILGCRLDLLDRVQATDAILRLAREGAGAQIVTLGTEMVVHAQHDSAFRAAVNASALSLCDTVGVLAVARRHGATLRERVTGVDLVERLCQHAAGEGLRVYLFGGAEGVAADAAAILEVSFPGLIIAGTRSGFFSSEEEPAIVEAIRTSGAQILFVGLGSPRQEMWLSRHLGATRCGVGIGVGGSFDVISGRVKRAPMLWRRLGIEWLYRLIREPYRFRRQLALPYFAWLILLEGLGVRPEGKGTSE
ncbi:MAG TPA: WecB/TagA/CpsF family glycosyltransferase [Candidatus Baltobacteraceae bacterium]|nr:WecB/TagA/CpsF family glycosyltransferase [Candidatus Baltobacteraceae bacterium]